MLAPDLRGFGDTDKPGHLLLGITPNTGLWPESEPYPLARHLESLESMRGLGADLVLPGHGPVFHDLDGGIGELIFYHEERLETMRREISDRPKTPALYEMWASKGGNGLG